MRSVKKVRNYDYAIDHYAVGHSSFDMDDSRRRNQLSPSLGSHFPVVSSALWPPSMVASVVVMIQLLPLSSLRRKLSRLEAGNVAAEAVTVKSNN